MRGPPDAFASSVWQRPGEVDSTCSALALNPDPVVCEQHMLAGIDLRHVAIEAAARGRNRAGGGRDGWRVSRVRRIGIMPWRSMTAQANLFVRGCVRA